MSASANATSDLLETRTVRTDAESAVSDLQQVLWLLAEAVQGHLLHDGRCTQVVPGLLVEFGSTADREAEAAKRKAADVFAHEIQRWRCKTLEELRLFFQMDDPVLPVLDASIAAAREAFNAAAWLKVNEAEYRERRGLQ
jgi:hypothetical protein